MRSFFLAYSRQRMALLWPNAEVFRAVLPEMLVKSEPRDLYYQHVLAPTLAVGERSFHAQSQQGEVSKREYASHGTSYRFYLPWPAPAAIVG